MLKNDLLLKTLQGKNVVRPPIWLLRQAGRHQKEYRELRLREPDFIKFCQNNELTTKAALIPIKKYNLDAAILFSDILTIPNALGMDLEFKKNVGPVFPKPIVSKNEIALLDTETAMKKLEYVGKAVSSLKRELNDSIPLIGFAGSPWTMATYMLEGKSSKTFSGAKNFALSRNSNIHELLKLLTNITTEYLEMQIEAGADVVMIFDTWGGILSLEDYKELSLKYMTKIITRIKKKYNGLIPTILFTKGSGAWLRDIKNSCCTCISLDWTTPISFAREQVGEDIILQGNLDPFLLNSSKELIEDRALSILEETKKNKKHIFNLGHGIPEDACPEKVKFLVDKILGFKY